MNFSPVRAGVTMVLFGLLIAVLVVPYVVLLGLWPAKRHVFGQLFFKGCLSLTGIKVNVVGQPRKNVAMFASNHSSYLDIIILGAVIREGVFVAKSEVADWPLFGILAQLARTVFISRDPRDAKRQRQELSYRMVRGTSLVLFPEGTSTDGSEVKPFKSSLFAALDDVPGKAKVQPITVVYTRKRTGEPMSQPEREAFTWFGDMTLAPHLINVFGNGGCEVDVIFSAPFISAESFDRKQLAQACENIVSDNMAETLAALDPRPVSLEHESDPIFIGAE
ncbi:lysophospholipid acyltransferase family protein [Magnetovibrio sp. PR-2]|uniref:lysophospholipid acyltransferase family protein n=1 Tax=Magnetovibrio sp. PR-2 TaxID=3120356 RepID=UPI002FCE35BB